VTAAADRSDESLSTTTASTGMSASYKTLAGHWSSMSLAFVAHDKC